MNGFGFIEYKDAMDARDVVPGKLDDYYSLYCQLPPPTTHHPSSVIAHPFHPSPLLPSCSVRLMTNFTCVAAFRTSTLPPKDTS